MNDEHEAEHPAPAGFHWKVFEDKKFLMLNVHDPDFKLERLIDFDVSTRLPDATDAMAKDKKVVHPRIAAIQHELLDDPGPPQRSEDWLRLRRDLITASDFAGALGENRYCSRQKLLWRKAGTRVVEKCAALMHGTVYEDEALAIYCRMFNEQVLEANLRPHPEHTTKIGGSPDGFAMFSGRLLEVKCPHSRKILPEVPDMYMPQCLGLCEIFDVNVVDFVQYRPPTVFNRGEFCVTTVMRDRAWWRQSVPVLLKFVDHMRERRALLADETVPPEATPPPKKRKKCVFLNLDLEVVAPPAQGVTAKRYRDFDETHWWGDGAP